jgi:hypothetical protein
MSDRKQPESTMQQHSSVISEPAAPRWLQPLLYMAAEQLAMQWNVQASAVDFKAHAGTEEDATFRASLMFDPVATTLQIYVHHKATGRFVCRSQSVILDELDSKTWNVDLASQVVDRR